MSVVRVLWFRVEREGKEQHPTLQSFWGLRLRVKVSKGLWFLCGMFPLILTVLNPDCSTPDQQKTNKQTQTHKHTHTHTHTHTFRTVSIRGNIPIPLFSSIRHDSGRSTSVPGFILITMTCRGLHGPNPAWD